MRVMRTQVWVFLLVIALLSTTLAGCRGPKKIGGELNILVMPGYEEEQIIKPFEEQYGVKVNAKIYPSSDQMFAILSAAKPGDWDIITPDTPWIERLVKANLVNELDPKDYPIKEFYTRWQDFDQCKSDGKTYAIVSRWGYYGIVYNSTKVSAEEALSTQVMWNPKYKGKVVLFDWYLPNMGMIGRYLGYDQPYDATGQDLSKIQESLRTLRSQVGVIAATNSDTIQALANGSAWLSFGGEWLQLILKEQGHPIEVVIPKEGGVSWTESLAIVSGSKNPEAAKKFIQYLTSAPVQAKLAWANAFHAYVPNAKFVEYMKPEQLAMLRLDDPTYTTQVLEKIATRKVPADEAAWQRIWEEFKSLRP
jgi:spermidine/putrescine transport system substrate-binding protein